MNRQVRSGITTSIARARGVMTRCTGSIDSIRKPSSCSVAFIAPISAAVADQAQSHHRAQRALGPEPHERMVALKPQHHSDRGAAHADDDQRENTQLM